MGQCLSAPAHGTPDRFKGRWEQGGLADGLSAFGGMGEPGKPAYTTTADVGLGPKGDQFGLFHEKAPAPLQLERIDEDATLQGDPESSPMKSAPSGPPASDCPTARIARKPINWTRGELVGQGAFGSVFVAMDNDTGELIAVKQVHIPRGGGAHAKKVETNIRSVEEEVQLLQQFDHDNIVRYLGTEKTDGSLNIFLEYVPGGSIASLLAKFGSFKESVIKVYTKQILLGLEYLHSKGVMHRDIKGANILVDNTGLVKVADFGASKKLEDLVTVADGNKSVKGTAYWMAPEVITQTGHGRQADLWSVACTVLEMATGRPPWSTQYPSQVAAMFHIASTKGPPEIPQHLSPECKDFLYLCFNRDWKARPLASTLLRHPFLADVPLRSQGGGPSPNAAALAQASRLPRSSSTTSSAAAAAMNGAEPSDSQTGTPSPLTHKLSVPRMVHVRAGDEAGSGSTAALSPLGHHAVSRQQQWDNAAVPMPQQQQQQPQGAATPAYSGRMTGSPVKRPSLSLRASAPAFSGYASVALSQQSPLEPLQMQLPPRAAAALQAEAATPQQLRQDLGNDSGGSPRASHDGGSRLMPGSGNEAGAGGMPPDHEAASPGLPADEREVEQAPQANTAQQAADQHYHQQRQQDAPIAAATAEDVISSGGDDGEVERTPPVVRQRAPIAAAPHSLGTSSGTSKSDWNPMEEPSWMHQLEMPTLEPGEGTPTSSLATADTTGAAGIAGAAGDGQEQSGGNGGAAGGGQEASSYPVAATAATGEAGGVSPQLAAAQTPVAVQAAESALGDAEAAAPSPPPPADLQATPVAAFEQVPSVEHMVWTNEDGDIDALPWDMGGWSAGSSAQKEEGGLEGAKEEAEAAGVEENADAASDSQQVPEQAAVKQAAADAVDEDALIGALRRKAQHDVRASLILFEKSLNIPAVHSTPSPKAVTAAAAATHVVDSPPAATLAPTIALQEEQVQPVAESIESRGGSGGRRVAPQQAQQAPVPQLAVQAGGNSAVAENGWRRLAVSQQQRVKTPGGREACGGDGVGSRPPAAPLAAAMGGLMGLGYGGSSHGRANGGIGGNASSDRESIWAQELSQELFRVKSGNNGSGGGSANRRVSLNGGSSPLKRHHS